MSWAPLIIAILQFFGPILVDWLRNWLENRFHNAAGKLPGLGIYNSEDDAREALFASVLHDLPRHAIARRTMVRMMQRIAARCSVTSKSGNPMSEDEKSLLSDLAGYSAEE